MQFKRIQHMDFQREHRVLIIVLCTFSFLLVATTIQAQKNVLSVAATGETFQRVYDASHGVILAYKQEIPTGSIIGRLNYLNRFQTSGVQPEVDWYPVVAKGTYCYVNYGYSASSLFPQHRAGAEVFQSLPLSLEASFGIRYLSFAAGDEVKLYTSSLGYYVGDYYIVARGSLLLDGVGRSFQLLARKYFSNPDEFAFVRVGGGVSPDQQSVQSSLGPQVYALASQSATLGWQSGFQREVPIDIQFTWSSQELLFAPGDFVQSSAILVGYRYRF
jgi:YaiO family outer membrane protein